MRICQRWNWWSGRASTSSERRQSQVRGLSQGVLSRHSSPGSTTSLCQSNSFVFTFVKGYPQNSTICSKFFLRTWGDTSMCTSVICILVSMPSSGNSWKWRLNTLLDLTLCAEAAWISINPWIQLRFLGQEFGRWIALLFEATSGKFDFGEIMSRLSRWASFIQVWKEIFLFL